MAVRGSINGYLGRVNRRLSGAQSTALSGSIYSPLGLRILPAFSATGKHLGHFVIFLQIFCSFYPIDTLFS